MKKSRLILIVLSVLILFSCIGLTVYLLFFNYQNVRLFKKAQELFHQGDEGSLTRAETLLQQIIRKDSDHEAAFIMLGEIARQRKVYPEQVYYCFMASRLDPLSSENKEKYIDSLCLARYFDRLENFLAQDESLSDKNRQLLLYAAGHNGNINKYKRQLERRGKEGHISELALLLFVRKELSSQEKLAFLKRFKSEKDTFLKQELLAAQTELFLTGGDIDSAEKSLLQAYRLNPYAFAPVLGRFYANHRSFGKALEIFEKHLSVYHDQMIAMQTAEIYCLLGKTDKIAGLRSEYQADSGSRAMLCSYYFDALTALAEKDMASLKELTVPLRNNIHTPLADFMFFCADIQEGDSAAIQASYSSLSARRNYLNLQEQADVILSAFLKKAFFGKRIPREKLLALAALLYSRKPELFTAKLILLAQKRSNSINVVLLKDALARFGGDQGVLKIAIEYYLRHELAEAERLIADYKKKFVSRAGDMLRYEIFLKMQKKDHDGVSALFRKHFSPALLPEYWAFASASMREDDLRFLSRDKHYAPFCRALLLLKEGKTKAACDLLESADAQNDLSLLFFAAKILAENGRNQAALKKYALFPEESPYKIAVLLNMAELYAENGRLDQALLLASRAYGQAPQLPETQLCYADKLYKKGDVQRIPDVIKITSPGTYRRRMEPLWIAGMQQRIKACDINTQRETVRELCRQLLVISPADSLALETLKKLHKMPQ
ncbi:MAG: hypothetical protein IKC65_04300 [Lentisphaeria bacterium]|nr:hypothetical protein [Lentisphaeria bacterium]